MPTFDSRNQRVVLTRAVPDFQFWVHGDLPLGRQLDPGARFTESFEAPLPLETRRQSDGRSLREDQDARYIAMRVGYVADFPLEYHDGYRFEIGSDVIWYLPPLAWGWADENRVFATSASKPIELRVVVPPNRGSPDWRARTTPGTKPVAPGGVPG